MGGGKKNKKPKEGEGGSASGQSTSTVREVTQQMSQTSIQGEQSQQQRQPQQQQQRQPQQQQQRQPQQQQRQSSQQKTQGQAPLSQAQGEGQGQRPQQKHKQHQQQQGQSSQQKTQGQAPQSQAQGEGQGQGQRPQQKHKQHQQQQGQSPHQKTQGQAPQPQAQGEGQGQGQRPQQKHKQHQQQQGQSPQKQKQQGKMSQQQHPQKQAPEQQRQQQGQQQRQQQGQQQRQQPAWGQQQAQQQQPQQQSVWAPQPAQQQQPQQQSIWAQQPAQQQQPQQQSIWAQQPAQQQQPQQQSIWAQPGISQQQSQPREQPQPKQQPRPKQPPPQQQQAQQQPPSQQAPKQQPSQQVARISPSGSKGLHLICAYKGPGTKGKRVRLEVNYLKLDISKLVKQAYHYDITIEPDKPKRLYHRVFNEFRKINFPNDYLAFDGQKNAYSPRKLDFSKAIQREVDVFDPENEQTRRFVVNIQDVRDQVIDLSALQNYTQSRQYDISMRAIQCLDIVLKAAFQQQHLNGVSVGRSFFLSPTRQINLGDHYELWLGLFQSTVLGSVPYVNVDIAHKAFPMRIDLVPLLQQIGSSQTRGGQIDLRREVDRRVLDALHTHLKGLRIGYRQPGVNALKSYKYTELGRPANTNMFTNEGRQVSVSDYFRDKGHPLQFPNLPCLNVGSSVRSISLPMEFCFVIGGQAVNKKCTENQTRSIIKEAATSTDVRKAKIMDILRQIQYNGSKTVQDFGLNVSDKFAEVDARILNPPSLQYDGNQTIRVMQGVWRGENCKFLQPSQNAKWGVLCLDQRTNRSTIDSMCKLILQMSAGNNLKLDSNYFIEALSDRCNDRQLDQCLENINKQNANILFCVIPDFGTTYARIKQAAEIRCGVLTQCIKAGTVYRKGRDGSTISNILLKVNAKLNGTNHKLERNSIPAAHPLEDCMIIGADVTHPSPDQTRIPSVVGVAASHDTNAFQYNICWRLQNPRLEIIQDFKNIIQEQLVFYQKKRGKLPKKLLYYRDGVSEGQFQEVMGSELQAMYDACQAMSPEYRKTVKITLIVVQKRHHTRFFPGNSGIGDRRNNNVPAGTIVDTQITHPNENHFYLVSHASIQGVAKPTKYCVLHDDCNFTSDDLQALTYSLCHMFARCNRSVSYPAPTYYAHLAAYRGRVYIEGLNINMRELDLEYKRRQTKDIIIKAHPMYFI